MGNSTVPISRSLAIVQGSPGTMLPERNIALQLQQVVVDESKDMARSPRKSSTPSASVAKSAGALPPTAQTLAPGVSLRQLAHELNSLLDGSMRCVGLARTSLQSQLPASQSTIDDGLGKAHAAMRHMASLLERAMKQPSATAPAAAVAMFDAQQTLQELFAELAALQQPHAQAAGAVILFDLPQDCLVLRAGPLGPVLMNGLRNAIEACAVLSTPHLSPANANGRRIALMVRRGDDTLDMVISGPAAIKPSGQRLGLALSEQIVRELGGELALMTEHSETILRVCVPLKSLSNHARSN